MGKNNVISAATTGEITFPLQPSFFAYVDTTISNVTGNNTLYLIIFENDSTTPGHDVGADYAVGTGLFTAPIAARYNIYTTVGATGITAAADSWLLRLTINSATITIENSWSWTNTTFTDYSDSICVNILLAAGDTVGVQVRGQGEAGDVWDITGEAAGRIFATFSGELAT